MSVPLASKHYGQVDHAGLKACLFDLDGVIVDTAKYHYLAWREIAEELGFAFTEADNEKLKGVSRMRSLEILLAAGGISLDVQSKALLAQKKNSLYLQYVLKMQPGEVLPGAREFLIDCRRNNLAIGLVSASKNATTILNHLQLTSLFDAVVDGNKVTKVKPDPEVFLAGARELGVLPQNCVVFEDAEAGVEAAIAANMFCVGIGDPAILGKANFVTAGLGKLSLKTLIAKFEAQAGPKAPAERPASAPGRPAINRYLTSNEWSVIEEKFDPDRQKASESIFSIGNGHMGQRANFEEKYSGETLQGSYTAGIYFPDKTRVGWWKIGYPEYFAKVLNSPNWIGIDVQVNDSQLDLAKCKTENFRRVLDMKGGVLSRSFVATMPGGEKIRVEALRFVSMANPEIGVVKYSVMALSDIRLTLSPYIDGDVRNQDANYDEQFWNILETESGKQSGFLLAQTRKLDFRVAYAMKCQCETTGTMIEAKSACIKTQKYTGNVIETELKAGETTTVYKYVAVATSLDYDKNELKAKACERTATADCSGFDALLEAHKAKWADIWNHSDIVIEGDVEAQQGIRFNIFHMNQTYTGQDERLNIGPKGFTGEKYGGSTYWDTEAYCIPFFISTAPSRVTRNLLLYRYKHLQKAIENAGKLGFTGGAALYPMVTMNGEECHNEWEITFEEIHRNGAIAFAIYNYIRHTGDEKYLADYGLEVLIGIARFWSQRATFSNHKGKYVVLGVTGPNEYENNVDNNWYTNTITCWCMDYAREALAKVRDAWPKRYAETVAKTNLVYETETARWTEISANMYFPYDEKLRLYLQQDGYLDKEQILAEDLDVSQRPINQHWSWDRILRSPFIKQADTLQGVYLFEEKYDTEFIKRHFDYYEARTVHESSLSPCMHSILAARIGRTDKAYELYLRTSRLDIDDYNHEVDEGLHITSMAGTWMAIVEGFGGKRVRDGKLFLNPLIHEKWRKYSFRILLKDQPLQVTVTKDKVSLLYKGPEGIVVNVYGEDKRVFPNDILEIKRLAVLPAR